MIGISNELINQETHALIGTLKLYTEHRHEQNNVIMEIKHIEMSNGNEIGSCSLKDAKLVCSPTELDTQRK